MSDVNETLQQLLIRRLREMGKERGRDEPMPLKEIHDALPEPEGQWASRELVRRMVVDGHTNIGPKAARTVATMFGLTPGEVLEAAGKRAPLGRFELPEEADRLEERERRVVLEVIDAILAAGERGSAPTSRAGGSLATSEVTVEESRPAVPPTARASTRRSSRGRPGGDPS